MDRLKALGRWRALRRMTVARGCTRAEAATAAKLAATLAARWGFTEAGRSPLVPPDFARRWEAAAQRAAERWRWEYRRCGKPRCHCARGGRGHGPYKYRKQRQQDTVRSIYVGR